MATPFVASVPAQGNETAAYRLLPDLRPVPATIIVPADARACQEGIVPGREFLVLAEANCS